MLRQEEDALSSALDNPVIFEALSVVISLHDTGYDQGHEDGLTGKPVRNHPEKVPELFKATYAIGHRVGGEKRESIRTCKEIARHGRRMGWCEGKWNPSTNSADHVVKPEQVKPVETPNDVFLTKQDDSFWKKYRGVIGGTIFGGILFGSVGFWIGKTKEQKRSMDVKRTMGVSEK